MVVRQEAFVQLAPQLLHQSRLLLREIVCFARISYDVKQARAEMGAVNEVEAATAGIKGFGKGPGMVAVAPAKREVRVRGHLAFASQHTGVRLRHHELERAVDEDHFSAQR